MNHLIKLQIVKLGQEAGIPWPQALPLALLRIWTKPQTKEGLSPHEILYGQPYTVQKGIHTQVGDEALDEYMVSLAKQLRKIEKTVFGARAQGLDGPVYNILPGDYVYVKYLSDSPLESKWGGPYQVLLTTHTAAKVEGLTPWIHYTRLKKAPTPQWTAEEKGPLKIRIQKHV